MDFLGKDTLFLDRRPIDVRAGKVADEAINGADSPRNLGFLLPWPVTIDG
jgi:hypothetical protein